MTMMMMMIMIMMMMMMDDEEGGAGGGEGGGGGGGVRRMCCESTAPQCIQNRCGDVIDILIVLSVASDLTLCRSSNETDFDHEFDGDFHI